MEKPRKSLHVAMSYTDLPRLGRLILFTIVTLTLTPAYTGSVEPTISAEGLAEILQYPADRIEVVDLTAETPTEPGVPYYSSHQYRTDDNTFSPILIQVARAGLILTAAENEELKKLLAEKEANPESSGYAGVFSFANGAYGARAGMVGPGAEAEDYHRAASGEPGLATRLVECARKIAANIIASAAAEAPVAPRAKGSEIQESGPPPAPKAQPPETVSGSEPAEVKAERPNILPFIFLGLVAILIGEAIMRKMRKR